MPPTKQTKRALGTAASVVATGLILNQRFGFTKDIAQLARDRKYVKSIGTRTAQLGSNTTPYRMLQLADQDASALWFEGRTWTYGDLKLDVDKFAAVLQQGGISVGDFVAVFMTNSPEMIIAFYAITKLGAVPALINTSLRSQTLEHCMKVANAKLIISTPDLVPAILDLYSATSEAIPCISLNLLSFPPLAIDPSQQHADRISQIRYEDLAVITPVEAALPVRTLKDTACLIYTSGTTGKPKAVNLKYFIFLVVSTPLMEDLNNKPKYFPLRTYSCLPLFHATGLFTGPMYCIGNNATFCLSRKFSASKYTQELVASKATRLLYVGELCRYLLRAPESPHDKTHSVIVANGNGMSRDVWENFKKRFNIPEIREFYRSTEGKAKFDNFSSKSTAAGYVGYAGPIRRYYEDDTFIVKYDQTTEQPYRDPKTGFCVTVGANEAGEAIGRVKTMDFYAEYLNNAEANSSKLSKDVFQKGDLFQRTGDLLMRNPKGWISFVDRTGDTYRWRGENVSAGEVREHIARLKGVTDIAVFAVKLDGYDGSAGAAAITLSDTSDRSISTFTNNLYGNLKSSGLTTYQVPRLVRIAEQLDTGATFKHAKEVMKTRPWDPAANQAAAATTTTRSDRLFWLNGNKYEPLTARAWGEIKAGRARL